MEISDKEWQDFLTFLKAEHHLMVDVAWKPHKGTVELWEEFKQKYLKKGRRKDVEA